MHITRSQHVTILSFAAAALVAACSDATAPNAAPTSPAVRVSLATAPAPDYFAVGDTAQAVRCTPKLRAAAASSSATWTGATIRWFMGTDRAAPVDSMRVPASEVAHWWGDTLVGAADGRTISLQFSGRLPFSADISFEYRTDGRAATATTSFDCGPLVAPATPEATIVGPTLVAHGGDLHPGDTIQVRYAAAAAGTLWETYVALYGACNVRQRFPEMAQPATSRLATFVIPAACHPHDATELGLAVVAFDAGGRPVVHNVGSGHYVVDDRLPTSPAEGAPNDAGEHVPVGSWQITTAPPGVPHAGEVQSGDWPTRLGVVVDRHLTVRSVDAARRRD